MAGPPVERPVKHAELEAVCRRHGVGLVYLFGSLEKRGLDILRGVSVVAEDRLADLDVGVVTVGPLPDVADRPAFYAVLFGDLEDLFHPLRLDLSLLEENHSVFQAEAVKGTCVYELGEDFRERYEMRVLRRAADFLPVLRQFHREVIEEVTKR
jgi:predicted nucleotidyltransferase